MKHIDHTTIAKDVLNQLPKGAFLTVKAGKALNTMTIGWGMIGTIWNKSIFTVLVRPTRYTFEIMEKAADFTVSFPSQDMKKQLAFCGTKSGRSIDKFKECDLKIIDSQKIISPIIKIPGIHFECKIVCKMPIDPNKLDDSYGYLYPEKDFHTAYYGEIISCQEFFGTSL